MEEVKNNIKVELTSGYIDEVVYAQQSDSNTRVITFELFNYTAPYDLTGTNGCYAIKRSNRTTLLKDVLPENIINNTITIKLDSEDLKYSGDVDITVSILKGNITLSLPKFTIRIPKPAYDKEYVESSDEYHSFLDALAENIETIKDSQQATKNCIQATQDSTTATENCIQITTECNTATQQSVIATKESIIATNNANIQVTYAKEQGDYAKQEADRVAGYDLSKVVTDIDNLKTQDINHNELISNINKLITNLENTKQPKTTARNSFIKADGSGLLIPTNLNKNDVGLNRVDNTRDVDKPISTHTRNEINNTKNILQNNINKVSSKFNNGGWILGLNASSVVGVASSQVEYFYYGYSTALRMAMASIVIRGPVSNHLTIGLRYKNGFSMPFNGLRYPKAVVESGVGVDNIYRAHDLQFYGAEIQIKIPQYTSMKSGQGYLHCNICMPY